MANADRPTGFSPSGPVMNIGEYEAGGTVYPGDVVAKAADGQVDTWAAGGVLGVAMNYATVGQEIRVADSPDQEFKVQADGADVDAQTDIGLNYTIVATAGSTTYRISRQELDSDTGATTATLPCKLQRIDIRDDNELGAQVDCIVRLNNHQLAGGTGTVGV